MAWIDDIGEPAVRALIAAVNDGDRKAFFAASRPARPEPDDAGAGVAARLGAVSHGPFGEKKELLARTSGGARARAPIPAAGADREDGRRRRTRHDRPLTLSLGNRQSSSYSRQMGDELLAQARQAQERLIDAERDADVARAEFHRAVRRLHLQGSSLRELAAALGLSHQRVHQIVEAAGGSRRWRRRHNPRPDLACSFCGRPQPKARKLIAGPGVYICERCVGLAKTVIDSGQAAATELGPVNPVPEQDQRARCSFCGKYRHQVAGLAGASAETTGKSSGSAAICAECLSLCDEIVAEELT